MAASSALFGSTLATLSVAALCGVAAPAAAQAQRAVALSGEAERRCLMGAFEASDGQITNFDTPSGSVLSVSRLADEQTLATRAATIELTLDVMCNGLHRVILSSEDNGLHRVEGLGAAGFGSAVPYRADVAWAEQRASLSADASSRQPSEQELLIGRAATGEMTLTIEIQAGAADAGTNAPLLAGEYADILTLTVEPR